MKTICSFLLLLFSCFICNTGSLGSDLRDHIRKELRPKRYILSIGVSRFSDENFSNLAYSQADAKKVHEFFHAAGFSRGEVLSGTSVKKQDIEAAIRKLRRELKESDTLVIYISSHGTRKRNVRGQKKRYIVTSDTDMTRPEETAVSYEALIDSFTSLSPKRKALILAFCHSGEGKSGLTDEEKNDLKNAKGPDFSEYEADHLSEGTFIYSAAMQHQAAFESPELHHDVYTYFLLDALNQDSSFKTLAKAHNYAVGQTRDYIKRTINKTQVPTANTSVAGSPFICISRDGCREENALIYSPDYRLRSVSVSVDGAGFRSLEKGLRTSPGLKEIVVRTKGNAVFADKVWLKAGMEYPVRKFLIPKSTHNVSLGTGRLFFFHKNYREKFAPESAYGIRAAFTREELYGLMDLNIQLGFYESRKEILSYGPYEISQKRQNISLDLLAGKKVRSEILSDANTRFSTYFGVSAGISALYHGAAPEEHAFYSEGPKGFLGGPALMLSAESRFKNLNMSAGCNSLLSYYSNFKNVRSMAHSFTIYVGRYW